MTTSQGQPFLSEVLNDEPIPLSKLAYFRERFRDRLYELVVGEFLKREAEGFTRADLARRIGRRPEQITRWLSASGNWTTDTASDLLLAIAKAEPDVSLLPLEGRARRNYIGQDILSSVREADKGGGRAAPKTVAEAMNLTGLSAARVEPIALQQTHSSLVGT